LLTKELLTGQHGENGGINTLNRGKKRDFHSMQHLSFTNAPRDHWLDLEEELS
jgi:hypothetical protein